MTHNFLSPLPTFTLESLVTTGQWRDVQSSTRKKAHSKVDSEKTKQDAARSDSANKSE